MKAIGEMDVNVDMGAFENCDILCRLMYVG